MMMKFQILVPSSNYAVDITVDGTINEISFDSTHRKLSFRVDENTKIECDERWEDWNSSTIPFKRTFYDVHCVHIW